jgi:hypothetical protein
MPPATGRTEAVVEEGINERAHFKSLQHVHEAGQGHLDEFAKSVIGLESVLAKEADLAPWLHVLETRPEVEQYKTAHRDLGLSLYSVSTGLYRQAFASLRSFLEVFLGNLHLSAAELHRRQWVSGRRDLSWSEITDRDSGVFSRSYIQEFSEKAVSEGDAVRTKAVGAYRRCSEYLHGNVATTSLLPSTIAYVPDIVEEWVEIADVSLLAIHHCMFVRYYGELDQVQRHSVEPVLEQHLSTHRSIRMALGLPLEEGL